MTLNAWIYIPHLTDFECLGADVSDVWQSCCIHQLTGCSTVPRDPVNWLNALIISFLPMLAFVFHIDIYLVIPLIETWVGYCWHTMNASLNNHCCQMLINIWYCLLINNSLCHLESQMRCCIHFVGTWVSVFTQIYNIDNRGQQNNKTCWNVCSWPFIDRLIDNSVS